MVQSRVSFSADCHSLAQVDSAKAQPGIRLGPGPEQPAAEVTQVHMPERNMKQDCQETPLPRFAPQDFAQGRRHQLPGARTKLAA
jgi:hypothetical protein